MQNTYLFIAVYIHSVPFFVFLTSRWADVRSYRPDFRKHFKFLKIRIEKCILSCSVLSWELERFKRLFICL